MTETTPGMTMSTPSDLEIVLTRVFHAPRALVFKALTDPAAIPLWWGPHRFTTIVDRMDARPGGVWRFIQHDADGNEFAFHGTYREITPPERIVSSFEFEGMPGHVLVETITLEEREGRTTLTAVARFASVEDRDGMLQAGMEGGAAESYDRLEELIPTIDREIAHARLFNAPRDLVFEAWTSPDHLAHWFGPRGFTITTHEMDVRPGGAWRFVMHGPDGTAYANRVVYREVVRPERLVYDHDSGDDADPGRFETTVTFTARGERTHLIMRGRFASAAARDRVEREYHAIEGGRQTLDRLGEYLAAR